MSKFKVGDRVRTIRKTYCFPVGHEFTIESIDPDGDVWTGKECVACDAFVVIEEGTPVLTQTQNTPRFYRYKEYQTDLHDANWETVYNFASADEPTEVDILSKVDEEIHVEQKDTLVVVYKAYKAFVVKRTVTIEQIEGAN